MSRERAKRAPELFARDNDKTRRGGLDQVSVRGRCPPLRTDTHTIGSTMRGLAAVTRGDGSVLVFATTAESPTNRLVAFVDDFVVTNPAAATLASSPANTIYRGVAPGPR